MDEKNKGVLSNFKKDTPEEAKKKDENFGVAEPFTTANPDNVRTSKDDNQDSVKESGVLSPDLRELNEPVATDQEGVDSDRLKRQQHTPAASNKVGTSDNPKKSENLDAENRPIESVPEKHLDAILERGTGTAPLSDGTIPPNEKPISVGDSVGRPLATPLYPDLSGVTKIPTLQQQSAEVADGPRKLRQLAEIEKLRGNDNTRRVRERFDETVRNLEEARAGRSENNIPLGDAYWEALNHHRAAYRNLQDA